MTHTTPVAPDNTGDYCAVRMTKAVANTASTAECDGPYAENSRFAAISAANFAVWSHIAPTISAPITPQRPRQACGPLACIGIDEIRASHISVLEQSRTPPNSNISDGLQMAPLALRF